MGYDVHITRREQQADEGSDILLEEWATYVESDPEMRMEGFAEAQTPDGLLRVEKDGLAVWTCYSKHEENGNMAWFYYSHGNIQVKNPDEEILRKMFRISQIFGAKVQGDEGELYNATGSMKDYSSSGPLRKWWQFWK